MILSVSDGWRGHQCVGLTAAGRLGSSRGTRDKVNKLVLKPTCLEKISVVTSRLK